MIAFDASEIANWADKPDASFRLPELARRLVLATCPMPSLIDMPSGSSVTGPGWDGLLNVQQGNAWVPPGASAWEFSVKRSVGPKANADYAKRTADPGVVDPSKTTFVFVTAQKWTRKIKWAKEKSKEGRWAGVRALDADDIVAWLKAAPAVAEWFAKSIGKMPESGWDPLYGWWTHWASMTSPVITPGLVLAGRDEAAAALADWARNEPNAYCLHGASRDEAIAFLAACAQANADAWGAALMARAVVVKTLGAWRSLENHYDARLALIRDFAEEVSAKVAVSSGHHVFTPLGPPEGLVGDKCKLPLLGRDETPQALMGMGLSESQARAHTQKSARRLLVLRRRLIDEAGVPPPEWVAQASPVASLVLIGKWDGGKEADREFVAKIAGKPYEEVENVVQELSNVPDAPFERVGSRWAFVSHEEAWYLLAPKITQSAMERFKEIAVALLRTMSPRFDLPREQRYMANIVGKAMPYSEALRAGVAQSLALMGVHPDRVKSVDDAERHAEYVVSQALNEAAWQTWATLYNDLKTLAEAAPEAFLNAVEAGLSRSPSPFTALFAQEGDGGVFGEAAHCGPLWALETLAWSEEHFSRTAKALARLAEIDPGGRLSNRPAESLSSLFLPWIKFTETPDVRRLDALAMLLKSVPQAGWQALLDAYPTSHHSVAERHSPTWRPWGQDGVPQVTGADVASFVIALQRLFLENVGTDADRWGGLVDVLNRLSPEVRIRAIRLLAERIDDIMRHPASNVLWEKIRRVLHHHRSYPDEGWALRSSELETLDKVYHALTPSDPIKAYAWMFNPRAGLPNPVPVDFDNAMEGYKENARFLEEEQQKAVRQAYEHGGDSAMLGIVEVVDYPGAVGLAVASSLDKEVAFALAAPSLGSPEGRMRLFARGVLQALFSQNGWPPLERALTQVRQGGSQPNALADVYIAAPFDPSTWERLAMEAQEVQEAYWKSVDIPLNIIAMSIAHFVFAIEQFVATGRADDVVELVALRVHKSEDVPATIIVKILESAPHSESYHIARLLEKLDESGDVSDEVIASLEILYLDALRHANRKMKIHEKVIRSPELFADLITWHFRRSDGQTEEGIDDQMRQYRARIAFKILSDLRGVPGTMDDGSLDAEALETWVFESRRLCKTVDREVIGDQQIGQILANAPAGSDGVWPCDPVRDLLDKIVSPHLGLGFMIGKQNLHGVTTRGMFDGGAQERSLAEQHREDARWIKEKWPFTAKLLCDIADSYEGASQWWDNEAAWHDRFEA